MVIKKQQPSCLLPNTSPQTNIAINPSLSGEAGLGGWSLGHGLDCGKSHQWPVVIRRWGGEEGRWLLVQSRSDCLEVTGFIRKRRRLVCGITNIMHSVFVLHLKFIFCPLSMQIPFILTRTAKMPHKTNSAVSNPLLGMCTFYQHSLPLAVRMD